MNYFDFYFEKLIIAYGSVDLKALEKAKNLIEQYMRDGDPILTFGNGGSAAIAAHICADYVKCIKSDCGLYLHPWMFNLATNPSVTTCIANDIGYEDIFSSQIQWYPHKALLLGISSSGNSPNIVKAFEAGILKGFDSIAFVGFDGGAVLKRNLANVTIHVKSHNYGICEDMHQIILHSICQELRLNNKREDINKDLGL
jgi:D-sedoheptulose 7-phosphate isomerase